MAILISAIRAFLAVARTRNFRRAAVEQRVSVSSLSSGCVHGRAPRRPPDEPHHPQRPLTEAGELLLARAGPAVTDIGAALDQCAACAKCRRQAAHQCPATGDRLVLAPMVGRSCGPIHRSNWRSRPTLVHRHRRRGSMPACAMGISHRTYRVSLGPAQRTPWCVTQYVAQHGRRNIRRSARSRLHPHRFGSGVMPDWNSRRRPGGQGAAAAEPGRDPSGPCHAAAVERGFLVTFEGYVTDAVKSGELARVLEDWCAPFPGRFLYIRAGATAARAGGVRSFVADWRKRERRTLKQT